MMKISQHYLHLCVHHVVNLCMQLGHVWRIAWNKIQLINFCGVVSHVTFNSCKKQAPLKTVDGWTEVVRMTGQKWGGLPWLKFWKMLRETTSALRLLLSHTRLKRQCLSGRPPVLWAFCQLRLTKLLHIKAQVILLGLSPNTWFESCFYARCNSPVNCS